MMRRHRPVAASRDPDNLPAPPSTISKSLVLREGTAPAVPRIAPSLPPKLFHQSPLPLRRRGLLSRSMGSRITPSKKKGQLFYRLSMPGKCPRSGVLFFVENVRGVTALVAILACSEAVASHLSG